MPWIKRNIFFVLSAAAGLILMGFASYLFYSTVKNNNDVRDDFQSTIADYTAMQQKVPYPSQENIAAAKEDQKNVREFLGEVRKAFAPFPVPPKTDEKGFKTLLEQTLFHLHDQATNAGVGLPDNYAFSFSSQIGKLTYAPQSIEPWMQQIEEIKAICDILFRAKINFLEGIQRVPVSVEDTGGPDYLQAAIITNQTSIVTPYKIMFRGFSTDLAAVLAGFAQSSNCFIVKNIEIAPSKAEVPTAMSMTSQQASQPAYYAAVVQPPRPMVGRGGGRGFPPGIPGAAPAPQLRYAYRPATSAAPTGPETILMERQLFITLALDVVKLKSAEH